MLKLPLEDFLVEVRAEIMGFEELGEDRAREWEARFIALLREGRLAKRYFREDKGRVLIVIEDEAELFSWVDCYWAALEAGEEEEYWAGFCGRKR